MAARNSTREMRWFRGGDSAPEAASLSLRDELRQHQCLRPATSAQDVVALCSAQTLWPQTHSTARLELPLLLTPSSAREMLCHLFYVSELGKRLFFFCYFSHFEG